MPEATAAPVANTPVNGAPANVNGKTAVATSANPPAVKAEVPTEEIKLNGKVYKVTKAQLVALAQKGAFADQQLKSVDALKASTANLINDLKTPEGILKVLKNPELGNSPKEVFRKLMMSDVIDDELKEDISKWVYDNVVVQSKKTPEEIERDKKLSDYEKLKKEKEERELSELSAKKQEQVKQIYTAIRTEVVKQILADKTFPQTEGTIRAVIEKMRVMNKKGAQVTVENIGKALDLVKKDHMVHQQALLDAIEDPEALISAIGEARALKISRALVARVQARKAAVSNPEKKEEGPREKMTDRIDKKLGRTPQGYSILDV